MTENKMGSGRPRKTTRRGNVNNSFQLTANGISDIGGAQVIVEPLSNIPGSLPDHEESTEAPPYSSPKDEVTSETCALCNCGQEMVLILGKITQYFVSPGTLRKSEKLKNDNSKNVSEVTSSDTTHRETKEKSLYRRRRRKTNGDTDSGLPPDMTTFGTANMQDFTDILDGNGYLFAHHCCAAWSAGVSENDMHDLENVDKAVAKALTKKCSHCQRYGASVECQVHRCNKIFHYPCCASAGAFQDINNMNLLCPDHLDRTEKLADADPSCFACGKTEDLNLQLFCTSCGRHFHNYCVDMTIPITPVVRMGWQCSYCKVCQGCKQPGDEDRMLCCDQCDNGYHTHCLDPPIATVPKSIWKCVSCRKCNDCGSTKPGGGPSSRWHTNYSICDRCYQLRKKGQSCLVCDRAVRITDNIEMLHCTNCSKTAHKDCDPDAPEENYVCPDCFKIENQHGFSGTGMNDGNMLDDDAPLPLNEETNDSFDYDLLATGQKKLSIEEAELFSMAASKEFIDSCKLNNNNFTDVNNDDFRNNSRLGSEDYDNKYDIADEKFSESTVDSPYSSIMSESLPDNDHSNFFPPSKKFSNRGRRVKKSGRGRGRLQNESFGSAPLMNMDQDDENSQNSVELPDSTSNLTPIKATELESVNTDDVEDDDFTEDDGEDGLHSTVLIVSTRDSFTLKQDVCMCCGSFGKGREGYLIGCVQCGQCFHPYCVNVKVNEVILNRGWRCIDCTVCEGCGRNADEANLLLCDLCDVSFHTYCLDPPLEEVPVGGWKCQWCAVCEDCGVKDPGFGCSWMANYSQCGQCSSEQFCSICSYPYEPNNLVIQCEKCDRWAHAECDGLNSEDDSQLACSMTYHCVHCRPKTKHLGIYSNLKSSVITKVSIKKALNNSNQPIAAKKTKTLHNLKSQKLSRAALREQKRAEEDAMPLVPHNAVVDESGVVGIELISLKGRIRCDETLRERLHLTDSGLKQIKGLVIRAPPARHLHRSRSRKKEEKVMSEEVTCSSTADIVEDHSMDKTEQEGESSNHPDNDVLSPDVGSIKQEEGMEVDVPDTTAETEDMMLDDTNNDDTATPDPEDTTDPFEFFGVDLLEKHLHMELELLSTGKKKKSKKERKKEKRLKKEAKMALYTGPSVPDPTALSLSASVATVVSTVKTEVTDQSTSQDIEPTIADIEQQQPDEAAISNLEATEEETVADTIEENQQPQMSTTYTEPSTATDVTLAVETSNNTTSHNPLEIKTDTSPPISSSVEMATPPMDLITPSSQYQDLPHVDGHEMAHFLAGIESESSMPSNSGGAENFPPPHLLHPAVMQVQFDHMGGVPKQQTLSPNNQTADPFKIVFGEEREDFGGLGSRKVSDAQKHLRHWESDERLGEDSTISPVLYANMKHKEELISKYKDWPSRGRAIGRLWRKLPAEQREIYRVKARENRIKLKENKKKKNVGKNSSKTSSISSLSPLQNQPTDIPITSPSSAPDFSHTRSQLSTPNNTQMYQVPLPLQQHMQAQGVMDMKQQQFNPGVSEASTKFMGEPKPTPVSAFSHTPTLPLDKQPHLIETRTPIGATVLTVPEPQQLSPLLQKISPPCAISSLSNVVRSSPTSPYIPSGSPYLPNTPSTPQTPATPISDSASTKSDAPDSGSKEKKKKPKLTKQEREQNKLVREQKKKLQDQKEQQWKLLQQQRIFEQQRQAILNQSKAMAMDPMHPSQRFNATMNSSLAEDAMQHSLLLKAKASIEMMTHSQNANTTPPSSLNQQHPPSSSTIDSEAQLQPGIISTANSRPSGASTPGSSQLSSTKTTTTVTKPNMVETPSSYHQKDQNLQMQRPLGQVVGGKSLIDPFHPGMSKMSGQEHYPDSPYLGNMDASHIQSGDQEKAFLVQQQYMASQQQYIQWQLAQQAANNMYNQGPKSSKPGIDKDMSHVENEEQHQERLRALFNQRQFHQNKPPPEQSSKRPVEIPSNQPFPPFPENRPNSMGYGYPSRMQPFPAGNTPEAAIYHQMLMECLIRYRKGLEVDPTVQIPQNQLYMMAEIAKQYSARQIQQQYGKGFTPSLGHVNPGFPYARPPFDDRMYPPYGHPMSGAATGLTSSDPSRHSSVIRPSGIPASSQKPNDMKSPPLHNKVHTSHGGLPKSASFEISRIAADSTSNDDFPMNNDTPSKENASKNTVISGENEISSSKGSRTLSDSTDSVGRPPTSDENVVSSAVSGHTQERDDDEALQNKNQTSRRRSLIDDRYNELTSRARRAEPRHVRLRYDEFDEEILFGRVEVSYHQGNEFSDDDDGDDCSVNGDEDRCLLDYEPVCTMGVLPEDEENQLDRGRLSSAGSLDENSTNSSRPNSRSGNERRLNTPPAMKPPHESTNRFANPRNIPDSAYIESLLRRSPINPTFDPNTNPPISHPGFPPRSIHSSESNMTVTNESRTHDPFYTSPKQTLDPKFTSPGSSLVNRPPPNVRPFTPTESSNAGAAPRLPSNTAALENRSPSNIDKPLLQKQNNDSSSHQSSHTNPASSWSFPNIMTPSASSKEGPPKQSKSENDKTNSEKRPDDSTPPRSAGISAPISSMHLGSASSTVPANLPPTTGATSSQQTGNVISILPGSPQYHQLFIYQHQLLIMQFQQYQFQLQAQFQQLRNQQMSSQQMMMLTQQYGNQMTLLQQQFNQTQAELHRMAATGIQFTEPQLNAMYQQQMITQQAYQQWIMALSPAQRMHLQQRMQACMQDVQHKMAQIMQQVRAEEEQKPTTKKVSKPRRPKKKATEQADLPPPKMPVPELSPSMQKLQQIGQQPSPVAHLEAVVSKPNENTPSLPVTTSIDQAPLMTTSVSGIHPNVTKSPSASSNEAVNIPFTSSPPNHPKTVFSTPQISPLAMPSPSIKNSIPSQIEEIQKSFIRQQQNIRKEIKKESTTPKIDPSPRTTDTRKQMFFPEKFPIHPSQLLRQKWNTTPGHSPTATSTPGGSTANPKLGPQMASSHSQSAQPILPTDKSSFTSQLGTQQVTTGVIKIAGQHQQPIHVSVPSSGKAKSDTNPSQPSPFSMSDILASKGNVPDAGYAGHAEMMQHQQDISKIPGFISPVEHRREMERKKDLLKLKKKEEKEKVMVEKRKARDIEKQKKMEEKAKLKVLREKNKAEKIQQRILIKQKAIQAKALAKKEAAHIQKQKQAAEAIKSVVAPPPPAILTSQPPKPPAPAPKIPLCEPDVQLVYSLVQPFGFNSSVEEDSNMNVTGKFGETSFEGFDDIYEEKPEPPAVEDVNSMLKTSTDLINGETLINDIPLFSGAERISLDDEDVPGVGADNVEPEINLPHEFRQVFACNNCFGPLKETVYYVDRGLDEVSEGVFDQNDVILSDQLAFCSNECVDAYQRKIDCEVDDDVALVDAVKAVSMVTLDESQVFQPLPSDEIRGDSFAPGMDPSKLDKPQPEVKKRWKRWTCPFVPNKKPNKTRLEREDLYELMNKYDVRLKAGEGVKDKRVCMLCNVVGDGETAQASRLLNYDVDQWVHLNCALWSIEVYEALNGGLHNVDKAYARAVITKCAHCQKPGASINCSHTFGAQQRLHCERVFHFCCAMQAQSTFYKDKTILCFQHKMFGVPNEELRNFTVRRKVYVERDITKQIARMLNMNNELDRKEYTFRVGNLIFHKLGQVPLHLLDKFSDKENVYPIGFETASIFWDYDNVRKRRYYTSSISEKNRTPLFKLKAHSNGKDVAAFTNDTPKGAWEEEILKNITGQRKLEGLLKFFPEFIAGETLFGLLDPTVRRMIESLPGIDTIEHFNFRFGRTPLLIAELPLALNPTGCVRSEKFHKHHSKRPIAIRVSSEHQNFAPTDSLNTDSWMSYPQRTAQVLVGTKTGQYRRMRQELRNTVILGRSRIQGLGLFLKRDVEENTFIIEYIGSLIRNEVANRLEGLYDRQNRGIYMFRIDHDCVVDATMTGGPARYINHSCDPSCVAEIVSIEGRKRIIIISNRRIEKGEELTYDYKFEFEDDSKKIACLCGASNCRKWMN